MGAPRKKQPTPVKPPVLDSFLLRKDGALWCAFFVPQGTVNDMFLVGAIKYSAVKNNPERRKAFTDMMRGVAVEYHKSRMRGIEPGQTRQKQDTH